MLAMKFYMFESEPFLSFSFAGERNFAGELGERGEASKWWRGQRRGQS